MMSFIISILTIQIAVYYAAYGSTCQAFLFLYKSRIYCGCMVKTVKEWERKQWDREQGCGCNPANSNILPPVWLIFYLVYLFDTHYIIKTI
jgi:hypothetical protein